MEPLTRSQRLLFLATTLAAAVSRWLALSKSPWDWDEMLFALGMRHYDVAAHHPHPPGFPLWIFFADLVHAIGPSEFHSLQFLAFLGGVAIVPAMFHLCRALRIPFATSLAAAAILAFFPNVWFYGGTALSDVPSMTLVVAALALLFVIAPLPAGGERVAEGRVRGATRPYLAGVVVLAVAGGIRPQNLLIGAIPLLLASVRRRPREVALAALVAAAILGASYGVAIEKTGWSAYRETVALHGEYIAKTDSYRSPLRPSLPHVFVDFFVRPYRMPAINIAVTLFAAISLAWSLARRRRHVLLMLAAFGPFCIFAWLMLDHFSASRFSIGYAPLIALLAADGIAILGRGAQGAGRRWWPRGRAISDLDAASSDATICAPPPAPCALVSALLVLGMAIWTWPALRVVHTTLSPPVQAIDWVRAHVDRHTPLYVHRGMLPYAQALLPDRDVRDVLAPPLPWSSGPAPFFLREDAGAINFVRPRGHLWWLARQRYFVVSVTPVVQRAVMKSGWYDEEGDDRTRWRWMGARGVVVLPPARRAHLYISFYVPLDALRAPADVSIALNGVRVAGAHVAANPNVELELDVDARAGGPNELVIETTRSVQPPNDSRVLGLRLNDLQWTPD